MADVLFTNVRIFDGGGEMPFTGDVLVSGNRIARVRKTGHGETGYGARTAPVMGAQVSCDVMNEVLAEHVAIKHLLSKLVWRGVEDAEFGEMFERVRDLLVGHSAWQEDQLFTTAAERLPADQLATLCDELLAFDNAMAVAA